MDKEAQKLHDLLDKIRIEHNLRGGKPIGTKAALQLCKIFKHNFGRQVTSIEDKEFLVMMDELIAGVSYGKSTANKARIAFNLYGKKY